MKSYRVKISKRAKSQLRHYIWYLVDEKNSPQAAIAVSDDYEETVNKLANVAGSLRLSEDKDLADEGI